MEAEIQVKFNKHLKKNIDVKFSMLKDHSKFDNLDYESSGHVGFASKDYVDEGFVNKVEGKGLSSNDYSNIEKEKVSKARTITRRIKVGDNLSNRTIRFDDRYLKYMNWAMPIKDYYIYCEHNDYYFYYHNGVVTYHTEDNVYTLFENKVAVTAEFTFPETGGEQQIISTENDFSYNWIQNSFSLLIDQQEGYNEKINIEDIKIPDAPRIAGTYKLRVVVDALGNPIYSWVSE